MAISFFQAPGDRLGFVKCYLSLYEYIEFNCDVSNARTMTLFRYRYLKSTVYWD